MGWIDPNASVKNGGCWQTLRMVDGTLPKHDTMDMFMKESQHTTISQQALGQLDPSTCELLDYSSENTSTLVFP
jgi:hypothetical protein